MEKKAKPSFTQSVDVQVLVKHLSNQPVGAVVGYAEIKQLIGRDPQGKGRAAVLSAIRILIREKQILFQNVMNEGYKRCDDIEALDAGQSTIRAVHKATRRGASKLSCSDYTKLKPDDRVRHDATASLLGMLAQTSRETSRKLIADKVSETHEKLPLGKTLELFLK